jgi:diacylglycerol kinase family enzyme
MPVHTSVTFIIIPVAGKGKNKHVTEKLSSYLKSVPINHTILTTQYARHGTELAREASKTSDFIIAVGGDGTMNEAAAALVHTNVTFGVLREGSGN